MEDAETRYSQPSFAATPDKQAIGTSGSTRYLDFRVTAPQPSATTRMPLALALVLDRSGSMAGGKVEMARRAAQIVIDQLDERDVASVVIFDQEIEVLQSAARVTAEVKARLHHALSRVEARGSTALHQGWLTGCHQIADDAPGAAGALARCFLLTDGLANVGLSDPEQIAVEAGGVRQHAGVSTSTFGIGDDYDELLLSPMAVAGGGQFHHLRSVAEIATTFAGELRELFQVVARGVSLQLQAAPGVELDLVSDYWLVRGEQPGFWTIGIGGLIGGEERHIVVGLRSPGAAAGATCPLRYRLVWEMDGGEQSAPWTELTFRYVDPAVEEAERPNDEVMRWVARHTAERALKEATLLSRRGDTSTARRVLARARSVLQPAAASDAQLRESLADLQVVQEQLASAPLPSAMNKEMLSRTQRRSRGQRDLRSGDAQ